MIEVIGVPFDLCGRRLGSRLGPSAIRLAGLIEAFEHLGLETADRGDIAAANVSDNSEGLRNVRPLFECLTRLRHEVVDVLEKGHIPVLLGGEHTVVTGGISAALTRFGDKLGLVWIDAHADINTPGSSTSGNLHGMPIAALAGIPSGCAGLVDEQWRELQSAMAPRQKLKLSSTVWYGLRDVDLAERAMLSGGAISMHDIDRYGVGETVLRIDRWLREAGVQQVWISFDVDALDPGLAPGTGTGVRGGLTYREAHLTAELLREFLDAADCPYSLAGVDIVETNPLFDSQNETAKMAVEWLSSLFGKTILGRR